ncbi:MAG: immunoglobulin-like domain-containing protein [Treponema sp.]
MKALIKITAAVLIGAACLGIAACNSPTNAGGGTIPEASNPGSSNPEAAKDKATVEAVKKQLTIQETVIKTQKKIDLPKSESGAKITWTSNNPKIIDADGKVTHQDGKGFDEVKLTATITKGKASDTKTFTVKVAQKDKELSPEETMDAVTISVKYDKGIYEDQQIAMPISPDVEGKTVTISYTSNDEKHLKCDNTAGKFTVHRDIADVTVQLSVKLTCDDKEKTREISVIIERIPEFKHVSSENTTTFTFDDSTLTKENSKYPEEKNAKFTYTADTKNDTVTLSRTHVFKNGTFCNKEAAIDIEIKESMAMPNALKAAYQEPSLKNFRHFINLSNDKKLETDAALIDYILKNTSIREWFEGLTENSTPQDFKNLEEGKKIQGIKKFCEAFIKQGADYYHIDKTLSPSDMLEKIKYLMKQGIREKVSKEFFTNKKFKYEVLKADKPDYPHGVWFHTKNYIYDENESWHRQPGEWSNIYYELSSWALGVSDIYYYGNFNSDYTKLTYWKTRNQNTEDVTEENGTWIFDKPVVASDGKVSMKATKQGTSEEVTIKFTPYSL